MSAKYCTGCGKPLPEQAGFCPACGKAVFDGKQPVPPVAANKKTADLKFGDLIIYGMQLFGTVLLSFFPFYYQMLKYPNGGERHILAGASLFQEWERYTEGTAGRSAWARIDDYEPIFRVLGAVFVFVVVMAILLAVIKKKRVLSAGIILASSLFLGLVLKGMINTQSAQGDLYSLYARISGAGRLAELLFAAAFVGALVTRRKSSIQRQA